MVDYVRSLALAQRLITANGRTVAVQKLSSTPADVNKPWEGTTLPTVATTVSPKAVFVPHTGAGDLGKYLVDEELLKRCDQVVLIAYDGTNDLGTFTQVQDGGSTWKIVWVRELKPGDLTILYAIGVSR